MRAPRIRIRPPWQWQWRRSPPPAASAPSDAVLLDGAAAGPGDDYLVEIDEREPARSSILGQILNVAQIVMFGVVAVLSLAVFWVIGLMIGAF